MANPIPLAPPVTSAVRPAKRMQTSFPYGWGRFMGIDARRRFQALACGSRMILVAVSGLLTKVSNADWPSASGISETQC